MRDKNKYNMMEPIYKAISSRDFPKEPGRNAPKLSVSLPLVAKPTGVMNPSPWLL